MGLLKNKKGQEGIIFLVLLGLWLVFTGGWLYDITYVKPIASSNANNYCVGLGFDQYKSFSRVGIWSENPVGIKCEYAERYTDLGVRIN